MGDLYAKAPFRGPEAVLAYLSLYTHRVAISNSRLIAFDKAGVTFRYKDYRRSGPQRQPVMTLDAHEFMRRLLFGMGSERRSVPEALESTDVAGVKVGGRITAETNSASLWRALIVQF